MRILHNGTDSFIIDQGTGNLNIYGDNEVRIRNTAGTEYKARFITDGAVELYYDNSKKFETTGYGVTIYNELRTPNLNVTGVSTFDGLIDANNGIDVVGTTTVTQLNATGISTFNDVEINGALDIYSPSVLIQNDLLVSGNLSVGGTFTSVNVADLRVNDKDLVLGITTNLNNDDVSNDNTANHGGVAIASTEGTPLVSMTSSGINTLPDTYKQMMWIKGGTYGIGTTDAFVFNYAVGIGSTNVPLNAYAAIGANHIYERRIETPNLTVAENANVIGILTGTTFDSETATIGQIDVAGTSTTGQLNVTGVSTFVGIATFQDDVYIAGNLNVKGDLTYDEVRGRNLSISGVGTIANIEIGTASTNTINTLSGALTLNSEIGFNVAISTHTNVVGYLSATDGIYYEVGDFNGPNGIAYFDSTGLLVSSASTVSAASTSNYLLTTNATGVPVWTNVFEGGSF
jgi:cytoskeletal protein CcmA (bactofilin family)